MITNHLHVDEFSEKIGTWEYNIQEATFTYSKDFLEIIEYSEVKLENINDFFAILSPRDQNIAIKSFSNTLNNNYPFSVELTLNAQTVKSNSLLWTGSVCETKHGKNVRINGLLQQQSISSKATKELEQLLEKANNLAKIGGWELDIIQNKLFWSPITKEIHGVDADFVPNLEDAVLTYKEAVARELLNTSIEKAISYGEPFEHEMQIITPDGREKWVKVMGQSDFIDGKCIRLYGSFQDINDGKQAEMMLRRAFDEKNTILESIGDAFFSVDREWTVTYWNQKAENVLGRVKSDILNKNLWEEFSDAIDTPFFHNYHAAFNENTSKHFESYYESGDKWFEVSAYPYDNGLSIYFRDITNRKGTEIEMKLLHNDLQKRTKELEISNIELEQFAYVASHDLQEPLRMVTSFLAQIEKKYEPLLDERGKQYIFFAVDGAKRMRQIILDLLEFSRVGKQVTLKQTVDINQIIQEIQQIFHRDSTTATVEILVKNNLPVIISQGSAIRQVFQNIIGNGIKYVEAGKNPIITIQYEDLVETHKFTISDNGIGIDPQYYDKIFVIFQRLHQKDKYPGTGIGLAITKKIIESLGGKIGVESEKNNGSTFYFTIPKK